MSEYEQWMTFWLLFIMVQAMTMLIVRPAHLQRLHNIPIGPMSWRIPKKIAWQIISLPALPSVLYFYINAGGLSNPWKSQPTLFLALYCAHYLYRTTLFPRRIKASTQRYSVVVIAITWLYYVPMGYFMGDFFARMQPDESLTSSPLFWVGLLLFWVGLIATIFHDGVLSRLRTEPSAEYKIPSAGLFRFSSNAHYFSEILEWFGFWLLTSSLPALLHFSAVSMLMLPQAHKTHRWYMDYFKDAYPTDRKALIPFVF